MGKKKNPTTTPSQHMCDERLFQLQSDGFCEQISCKNPCKDNICLCDDHFKKFCKDFRFRFDVSRRVRSDKSIIDHGIPLCHKCGKKSEWKKLGVAYFRCKSCRTRNLSRCKRKKSTAETILPPQQKQEEEEEGDEDEDEFLQSKGELETLTTSPQDNNSILQTVVPQIMPTLNNVKTNESQTIHVHIHLPNNSNSLQQQSQPLLRNSIPPPFRQQVFPQPYLTQSHPLPPPPPPLQFDFSQFAYNRHGSPQHQHLVMPLPSFTPSPLTSYARSSLVTDDFLDLSVDEEEKTPTMTSPSPSSNQYFDSKQRLAIWRHKHKMSKISSGSKRARPQVSKKRPKRKTMSRILTNNVLIKQQFKCAACLKMFSEDRLWDFDHIIPLHNGGEDEIENIQALCLTCHRVKTNNETLDSVKKRRFNKDLQVTSPTSLTSSSSSPSSPTFIDDTSAILSDLDSNTAETSAI